MLRNRSQARAVALALGLEDGEALLIQGPPGTGKSTTAAEIDVQLILRDPGVRILVCSHSNHGTDNMLMKVLPFLEDAEERIARIGYYERIARDARPFYAAPDADLGDRNVIFTTIDALILQDVAGARVYDYVILDEANRAGVLDSLLALARGKRMILVGDPMQLQPVMSEAEQQIVASANGRNGRRDRAVPVQPGGNHVIGKSLFAWIQERHFSPGAAVLLDQQNRMHPAIGELVSRVFYSSRVRTGPAAPRRGTGMTVLPSPVTWVDTRSLRGNVESRAGGTSLFNLAEARLVTSITRYVAAQAPPNLSIGVITAYAEQRDLLRRLMGPHEDWPPERQLEIDTVDAFEGREKDIIILSLVRANRRRDIGFLRLEQRLNVAVSRARRLLIVVGDTSTLRGGYFQHLIATAGSVGAIVPAPRLLGQLLHRTRKPRPERVEVTAVETVDGVVVEAVAIGADGEAAGANGAADSGFDFRSAPATGAAGEASQPGAAAGSRRRRRRRALERLRERRAAAEAAQVSDASATPDASDAAADQASDEAEHAAFDAAGAAGAADGTASISPPGEAGSAPAGGRASGQSGAPAAPPDALARRPRARRRLARLALSASAAASGAAGTDGEPASARDTARSGAEPAGTANAASNIAERAALADSARSAAEPSLVADGAPSVPEPTPSSAPAADAPRVVRRGRRPAPAASTPAELPTAAATQVVASNRTAQADAGSLATAEPASPSSAEHEPARPRRGRRRAVPSASTADEPSVLPVVDRDEPVPPVAEAPRPRGGRRRTVGPTLENGEAEAAAAAASEPVPTGTEVDAPRPRRGRPPRATAEVDAAPSRVAGPEGADSAAAEAATTAGAEDVGRDVAADDVGASGEAATSQPEARPRGRRKSPPSSEITTSGVGATAVAAQVAPGADAAEEALAAAPKRRGRRPAADNVGVVRKPDAADERGNAEAVPVDGPLPSASAEPEAVETTVAAEPKRRTRRASTAKAPHQTPAAAPPLPDATGATAGAASGGLASDEGTADSSDAAGSHRGTPKGSAAAASDGGTSELDEPRVVAPRRRRAVRAATAPSANGDAPKQAELGLEVVAVPSSPPSNVAGTANGTERTAASARRPRTTRATAAADDVATADGVPAPARADAAAQAEAGLPAADANPSTSDAAPRRRRRAPRS